MAPLAQAPAGSVVGHYQILCQVGAGGMGTVYKAFDTTLHRTVALKFLSPDPINPVDRDALLNEARAASTLDHKNIATVHAVEQTEDGQLFLVMAYYEGRSLAARMTGPSFTPSAVIEIVRQIAEGLSQAHQHSIVHRDIKPSNVILTSSGEAKIVDFGLARFVSPGATTQTLTFSGTLSYMSPEQVMGRTVDARSDIWSLGVIAYQLLANRLPFPGDNPAAIVNAIQYDVPRPLETPKDLQRIVDRALAKRVQDRYQSCTELLNDLRTVGPLLDRPVDTVTVQPLTSRRWFSHTFRSFRLARRQLWISLFMLMLAAVLGFAFRRQLFPARYAQADISASPAAYESYLRGLDYLRRYDKPGNLDAAIKLFQSTTQADPKFALAFAALGEAYWIRYTLGDDPQWVQLASAACQRAAELNNQLPAVYVTLGRIHSGTGQRDLAIQEFQRAQELDHHNTAALLGLADAYSTVGRTQEAEDLYKRAIAMRPEIWDAYHRLGAFYYDQRRFSEAAEQFRRLIELLPDHASAYTSLGTTLLAMGRTNEAEAEFKKSLSIGPDYAAASNLGVIYYTQKRYAEAAAITEKALHINDKDYRLWNNLAITYEWLDQPGKAREAFHEELTRLEQLAPLRRDDADLQANLGVMYSQLHLRDKTKTHLAAALALSPDNPDTLGKAGEAYENLGERSLALTYFQKALHKGWTLEDLETNPDLRPLLSDPNARRVLHRALASTTQGPG
jgi:eukaryotic-like serine/threonine-protein kinase